jgi:hypothetical protein
MEAHSPLRNTFEERRKLEEISIPKHSQYIIVDRLIKSLPVQ